MSDEKFYKRELKKFLKKIKCSPNDSVLILAASSKDERVCQDLGLKKVTVSNIDISDEQYFNEHKRKFPVIQADMNKLALKDNSYDIVIVHASVHHAREPHKVITEMYRVAKKAAIVFEAGDSKVVRFIQRLGIIEEYEEGSIFKDPKTKKYVGGVDNTEIPNFVYRWTELEVKKTIKSFAPEFKHPIYFAHAMSIYRPLLEKKGNPLSSLFASAFLFGAKVFNIFFPKQGNLFAFCIDKEKRKLQPWLLQKGKKIKFKH